MERGAVRSSCGGRDGKGWRDGGVMARRNRRGNGAVKAKGTTLTGGVGAHSSVRGARERGGGSDGLSGWAWWVGDWFGWAGNGPVGLDPFFFVPFSFFFFCFLFLTFLFDF